MSVFERTSGMCSLQFAQERQTAFAHFVHHVRIFLQCAVQGAASSLKRPEMQLKIKISSISQYFLL